MKYYKKTRLYQASKGVLKSPIVFHIPKFLENGHSKQYIRKKVLELNLSSTELE